jgi:Flp pilus assembly protein TadB
MNTAELVRAHQTSQEEPSFGDEVTEFMPWLAAIVVLGPFTFLCLMLWAPFLVVVAVVLVPALVASLLVLGAAILALPFLIVRHVHHRLAERRRSAEGLESVDHLVARVPESVS